MRFLSAAVLAASVMTAFPARAGWVNLDDAHRIGGRKCSADYLVGKVVMVCRWTADEEGVDAKLARMEELWTSFKTKNFVLVGSFGGDDDARGKAKDKIRKLSLTFPVYAQAGLDNIVSSGRAVEMYVVDALGAISYMGKSDRRASEVFIEKISGYDTPIDPVLLKKFFDFEAKELPGRAMIRYAMFKKDKKLSKNKELAKHFEEKYKELRKIDGIRDLTALVTASRKYKDHVPKNKMARNRLPGRIEAVIKKYGNLKDNENPVVAREAKGALADLMWALAGAKKK